MKVSELKQIIKPLIKECLKEVLVEEGFAKMLQESKEVVPQQKPVQRQIPQQAKTNLQEAKKKLLDSIGNTGFDAFAGTQPLQEDKQIIGSDPGVDISSLMGNKQIWKQTLDGMNGKKGNK